MPHTILVIATLGVLVTTFSTSPQALGPANQASGDETLQATLSIPQSLQDEHTEIHHLLVEATKAPGRVGVAAQELAALLDPHFARENEIALPPLGLLAPLAAGQVPAGAKEALAMADALRKELPRMLEEHKQIRAATEKLHTAARAEKSSVHEQFAEKLAAHARTEEEVLYPAAILVGDLIRARMAQK